MDLSLIIATNIQHLMEQAHVTQNELAEKLGLSRQTVSKLLKGKAPFDIVQLEKIAGIFRVSLEDLLNENRVTEIKICYRLTTLESNVPKDIKEFLSRYIERFRSLSVKVGDSSIFIPEQYNLFAKVKGKRISVLGELENQVNDSVEIDIDETLVDQISTIADEQRKRLELNDGGAIDLISALSKKGIKVIFLDFGTSEVSGASVCDQMCGCYIFVNTSLTVERQLFTVAHEYGHVLLHRQMYSYSFGELSNKAFSKYLDSMASKFAARLLCPPDLIDQYDDELNKAKNNLQLILSIAVKIKRDAQLSLQSVMKSLRDYGYISKAMHDEFYTLITDAGLLTKEPLPIAKGDNLYEKFLAERNLCVTELVVKGYFFGIISEDDIAVLYNYSREEAQRTYTYLVEESKKIADLFKNDTDN
jgi:Zn-dependent peptidase ImmA (M78 family)/transcriptional regulator with XRE-family HTH domain